jgi:hypothetical protein
LDILITNKKKTSSRAEVKIEQLEKSRPLDSETDVLFLRLLQGQDEGKHSLCERKTVSVRKTLDA